MKYIVTGSTGHISKPLAQKLVSTGNDVSVISSNESRRSEIEQLGATPLIGSVLDTDFLRKAFDGADAVYTMIPPHMGAANWKQHIGNVGKNYANALAGSGVKHVVNLSSIGAHMPEGCGPVSGLYVAEQALNAVKDVNVIHLRPGYFYYNFFSQISLIRNGGIMGGNYGDGAQLVMVHTDDIADVAAEYLIKRDFTGKGILYVVSDEIATNEVAEIIGSETGIGNLKWIDFTDEQSMDGLIGAGLPPEIASNYTEMGQAIRSGEMFAHYKGSVVKYAGKRKFREFAKELAGAIAQEA